MKEKAPRGDLGGSLMVLDLSSTVAIQVRSQTQASLEVDVLALVAHHSTDGP